ncbi:MAG: neutral/alkaline non-lysosomal ceramidase N-terminal domain-containing protein [Halobacteriales archaeon]
MVASQRIDEPRTVTDGGSPGAGWRAGVADTVITPEVRLWMGGYADRRGPAEGVHLDLHAKALAFEDGAGNRAVVVSVEVSTIPGELRAAVAERCESDYGLAPERLLVNASHTHCGPEFRPEKLEIVFDVGPDSEIGHNAAAYRDRLEDELVALVGEALDDCRPATLQYSRGACAIATSRRRPTEDGVAFGPHPDGPSDHDVPVLSVSSGDERRAILFGYACHPSSLMIQRYSGDWAGHAQRVLEEAYPSATAVFLQGCGGDQKAYPQRTLDLAEQHGRTLANAVRGALESRQRPVGGPLRVAFDRTELGFTDPPSREQLERDLDAEDPQTRASAAALLDELDATGDIETTREHPIQAVGFGADLTLVAMAGEPFAEYGIALKDRLPGPTWVAGYSHETFPYLPTESAHHEGGYEVDRAPTLFDVPSKLAPDAERRVLHAATALGERVTGARYER